MLTAGAKSYTYDAAGRTVGINAPSGTTTLTYDYESRVTAITGPGINETHTYNGLDTRVGTVQGGVSRTFVRDGSYVTDPVLRDGEATYTPGVSERRGGVSTWSHSGLKNADAQTTSVGAIAATRVYDAFGAELSATGTWKGPFGYAGGFGYQEDSSGLKLLGHRYYDPTTGRFLSRDPIKDGRNWYVYCGSNPASKFDDNGLKERPLTPHERTQVEKAIERLDAIGENDLAKIARDMLKVGAIMADEALEGAEALTGHWPNGKTKIWLNPRAVLYSDAPRYPIASRENDLDWLTAIIGHEAHHAGKQGLVWKRFHPNQKEVDGWAVSIRILRKLRERRTGRAAEAVDRMIADAIERAKEYGYAEE